jgi:hypothetical protein
VSLHGASEVVGSQRCIGPSFDCWIESFSRRAESFGGVGMVEPRQRLRWPRRDPETLPTSVRLVLGVACWSEG